MIYVKLFEKFIENLTNEEINKLKDLCDAHFAYLYDDNYIANVENKVSEFGHDGRIKKPYTHIDIRKLDESTFTWSDIKDYFIPFTNHLHSEYPLARITFRKKEIIVGWVYQDYNIEDILEDNIKDNLKIREVSITI